MFCCPNLASSSADWVKVNKIKFLSLFVRLLMNPLIFFWSSADSDVSSPSRATRSPPRRLWLGTDGPSTTDRCQSPTSRSLLKASSRSIPTLCSSTLPWWGRRCPTRTPPPWWSNRSRETSPTTQVRHKSVVCMGVCVLLWSALVSKSHEATAARALSFQEWEKTCEEGAAFIKFAHY